MDRKSVFLDVDSSLRERNYLLAKDPVENEMEKFFSQAAMDRQMQPKLVKPSPGMCLKTKNMTTGKKLFMNICLTEEIPAPMDISETELARIINSEEISDFRVPMSIGELHVEEDKKGSKVDVYDIAVNTKFFKKVETMKIFQDMFLAIVVEGVQNKYSLTLDQIIILKNKKAMGTLQVHRLRPREMKEKMGENNHTENKLPSLTDILPQEQNKRKLIEAISSPDCQEPKYRLVQKKDDKFTLYAEIYLPYIISHEEISLSIGEDRLILDSKYYFLDIFMDFIVDRDRCTSVFNKINKFLTITMAHKDAPKATKNEDFKENEIVKCEKEEPEYRLYKKPDDSLHLYLAVSLPKIKSPNDINLELGIDEVKMETPNYLLNLFVDFEMDVDRSTNYFDESQKLLTVTMTHLKAQKSL